MEITKIIQHFRDSRLKYNTVTEFSNTPGIYAIFYNGKHLPYIEITFKNDEIIYIGKTESSQLKRNANTHFASGKTGSSTVRKSIGAILRKKLSLIPIPRNESDYAKGRKSHFKFDDNGEIALTEWMKSNLSISYYEYPKSRNEIESLENQLINSEVPILNIDKNSSNIYLNVVKQLRKDCASHAHSAHGNETITKKRSRIMSTYYRSPGAQGKYGNLWKKKIPQIIEKLKQKTGVTSIDLNRSEFLLVGSRKNYSFNLVMLEGDVGNNIGGSAVARDLAAVLINSSEVMEFLRASNYKFNMDKGFNLTITRL